MRVIDLIPGDLHINPALPDRFGVYVCQTPHPLFRSMQLVVWRLSDGRHSMDALDVRHHLQTAKVQVSAPQRLEHLRWALGQDVAPPNLDTLPLPTLP